MKKRVIKGELSVQGIRKIQHELENYRKEVIAKTKKLAELLSEKGVETAKVKLTTYDAVFTGELQNSIENALKENKPLGAIFIVRANSEYACFVEFGTGQVGKNMQYPYPLPEGINWEYQIGDTIFEFLPGQFGWFYPGDDGQWHLTQGMPARPFMYETCQDLYEDVVEIAKKVFSS